MTEGRLGSHIVTTVEQNRVTICEKGNVKHTHVQIIIEVIRTAEGLRCNTSTAVFSDSLKVDSF